LCLHSFEPSAGDCIFIPAGTVHALGAGLLVAEIQQASDTTFRLFDWNRVGADGKSRELHIDQALDVIDFDRGPVDAQSPQPTDQPHVQRLVDCDKFVLDRWTLDAPQTIGGDGKCRIIAIVAGCVTLDSDELPTGSTVLLPAAAAAASLIPQGVASALVTTLC
jgi:mannose-6-phosphate isomerase